MATINPSSPRPKSGPVSFIPMAAIKEGGRGATPQVHLAESLRGGFTVFQRGDILIAKITPCFQNGKFCLTDTLPTATGLATTEVHVLRPSAQVTPEFLFHYLMRNDIVGELKQTMKGSAGQQRVPVQTLGALELPLPPLNQQESIVAAIRARQNETEKMRCNFSLLSMEIHKLKNKLLSDLFSSNQRSLVKLDELLTQQTKGVGTTWDSYPVYGATRQGLALAKEKVGKHGARYKPVSPNTIF